MNSIYKTPFNFHIDLSKILSIDGLSFTRGGFSFSIKFELSDTEKFVFIDSIHGEMKSIGDEYGYVKFDGDITKRKGGHHLSTDMSQTIFFIRAKEMHEDLLSAWKRFKNEI